MKRLPDYWGAYARFGAALHSLDSWYSSFRDPTARMFKIAQYENSGVLIWIMGIIGVVLLLDVIFNDCTPDTVSFGKYTVRIRWKRIFIGRHYVIMALATCYAFHPYIAERGGYELVSSYSFYSNAFLIALLAIFDAKDRTRSTGWQRAFS